jgi:beta-glucosidase/6-phospho-beta-glucosidase/beta-galactosidase
MSWTKAVGSGFGSSPFPGFLAAGFECSTHIRRSGHRQDLIADTGHDRFALLDYQRARQMGFRTTREGVRWHLVEQRAGHYDFSSAKSIVQAARSTGAQVVWDLCHFGWPEFLDVFSLDFRKRLAAFGAAFSAWLARQIDGPIYITPVNEISFFSWACGDEGSMFPFVTGRGLELKQQLVRASIETMEAIWQVTPHTRFLHVDPIINVIAHPRHPEEAAAAEAYRLSQYQAFDMLTGRAFPELGGDEKYLDIVGINYYPHNQWFYNLRGTKRVRNYAPINRRNPLYRPFRQMLAEVHERYDRPIFIAETGAENRIRASWFRYVCEESLSAMDQGVPLHGICLYPILNHPGWVDDRHCHNGLWDYPDPNGNREIYKPLAAEIRRWRPVFERELVSEHAKATLLNVQ